MKRLILKTMVASVLIAPLLFGAVFVVERLGADPKQGRSYVILLRHGDAPGRNEPQNFDISDCRTQRNLSDKGRNEAREIGREMHRQGINVTKVLTSRWCRTKETADLLNIGSVENEPAFDNLEFNKNRSAELLERERAIIAAWHGPGVLVVVTHNSNIKGLTGLKLEQGAMVVANPTESSISFHFSKIMLKDIFS